MLSELDLIQEIDILLNAKIKYFYHAEIEKLNSSETFVEIAKTAFNKALEAYVIVKSPRVEKSPRAELKADEKEQLKSKVNSLIEEFKKLNALFVTPIGEIDCTGLQYMDSNRRIGWCAIKHALDQIEDVQELYQFLTVLPDILELKYFSHTDFVIGSLPSLSHDLKDRLMAAKEAVLKSVEDKKASLERTKNDRLHFASTQVKAMQGEINAGFIELAESIAQYELGRYRCLSDQYEQLSAKITPKRVNARRRGCSYVESEEDIVMACNADKITEVKKDKPGIIWIENYKNIKDFVITLEMAADIYNLFGDKLYKYVDWKNGFAETIFNQVINRLSSGAGTSVSGEMLASPKLSIPKLNIGRGFDSGFSESSDSMESSPRKRVSSLPFALGGAGTTDRPITPEIR